MAGTELRQVRFEASEGVGGWSVRLVLTQHDEEGSYTDPIVVTMIEPIPVSTDTLDQAWLVLLGTMQIVDDLRGHGYDSDSRYEKHQL
jgi:hypothetical protein